MVSWWLDAKPRGTLDTLPATFSAGLYDVLMHQRNRDWRRQLEALPARDYVVAVGALHLYGEDNLPAMLQPQGLKRPISLLASQRGISCILVIRIATVLTVTTNRVATP